ncbi:hypothetical protein NF419_04870 [Streptococcus suis]|nr:hypothetical protein [Streptococcus suis]MCQ8265250.1 hypothetical protein [Streptococcus suis]
MVSTSTVQQYLKNKVDTAILAMKMSNQALFTRSSTERETDLPIDEIYLHARDVQTRLKISRPSTTGDIS